MEPHDRGALQRLLMQEPLPNIFLLSLMGEAGAHWGSFHGFWDEGGALTGVLLAGHSGLMVPYAPVSEQAAILARSVPPGLTPSFVIGPRDQCDDLLKALRLSSPPLVHYEQRLLVCREPPPGNDPPGFRKATQEDLDQLCPMAARMMGEDLGVDPARRNPAGHRRMVERRVLDGRTWVVERGGRLVFKIDLGASTSHGALLGGTWVEPDLRGMGFGREGMAAVTRLLLRTHPAVTLHVNEANEPALGCYLRCGFMYDAPFRLALFA